MYAKQNELTLEVHSIESDVVDGKYGKYGTVNYLQNNYSVSSCLLAYSNSLISIYGTFASKQ